MHIKQYRQWRHNGIAFEFGDQTYSEPNRTMMTYTEGFVKKGKEKGLKKEVSLLQIRHLGSCLLCLLHSPCTFLFFKNNCFDGSAVRTPHKCSILILRTLLPQLLRDLCCGHGR